MWGSFPSGYSLAPLPRSLRGWGDGSYLRDHYLPLRVNSWNGSVDVGLILIFAEILVLPSSGVTLHLDVVSLRSRTKVLGGFWGIWRSCGQAQEG